MLQCFTLSLIVFCAISKIICDLGDISQRIMKLSDKKVHHAYLPLACLLAKAQEPMYADVIAKAQKKGQNLLLIHELDRASSM